MYYAKTEEFRMADKKETKQLTDEELKNVSSGMKIVIDEPPSFWQTLLRFFFKVKH